MTDYTLFPTQHSAEYEIEEIAAEIIYMYLFQGIGVKGIETELFGEQEFHGYFAKTVLNYFGIDTSVGNPNRGLYKGEDLHSVAVRLLESDDRSRRITGRCLMAKLEDSIQSSSRF